MTRTIIPIKPTGAVFLVALLGAFLWGCKPVEQQRDIVDIIPSHSAMVVKCDLDAWLKASGCQSSDGAITLTPELSRLLTRCGDDLTPLLGCVAGCGTFVDLRNFYLVKYDDDAPLLAMAPLKADRDMPDTLPYDDADLYGAGKVRVYTEGKVRLVEIERTMIATMLSGDDLTGHLDKMLVDAEKSPIGASAAWDERLRAPVSLCGYFTVPEVSNYLGDDFSRVAFEGSFTETTVRATLTFTDDAGKEVQPFAAMSDVDPDLFASLPANAVLTAALGLGGNVKTGEIVDEIAAGMPAGKSIGLRLVYAQLAPVHGQLTVGVAPGGSAESLRRKRADAWMIKALLPLAEERSKALDKLIGSVVPGKVYVYGYGDYTIVQNYGDDAYPDSDDIPDIAGATRIYASLAIPYGSEVMKAAGLKNGVRALLTADASTATIDIKVLGPGYVLPALINMIDNTDEH